ncbi:MAG: carbohydrate ABC transporter permease [Spirochaetia bacterium]|nr:carbohydrate ABC transporter permease [Spirochaetia bacterium]
MLGCLLCSLAGFAYTCFDFKGRNLFYLIIMVSFMVPFEAIAIPLYAIANKMNLIDTYSGMILPAVADGLVTFLFIQFFKDLPVSLVEAAMVDGAKWPTIFFKIIIPISIPIFVTSGLMIFMTQWNSYLWPLLVARSKEIRTIQIAISEFVGEYSVQWTYIYAATIISAGIPIALFLPLQKYYIEGVTAGSIKG